MESTEVCVYQMFTRDVGCCAKEGIVLVRFKEKARRLEVKLYENKIK
ncbi:hypothetical protein NE604_04990 [Anaerofustis stercorihominis]|uniref:Uncharacterized protein n=1 Tax=Anaerofustis stercorihominis DSM 17244 TaxID=445971 RepID=B1C6K3_9FIRM|nr:hypothetical protein [Anaerofustis stercorihominis]EDS73488.1 hypothetical protein ANASTE_00343 [Anaerofustis stercorihominis DSM 17244]MCQ4795001.1 hypothetical protein [Anaerofustis stercorihominis]